MDSASISLAFENRSQHHYEPVRQRLRKMKERNQAKEEIAASLMDKVRANGRSGRVDWLKGKMRWFVGGKYAAKIKANIEVEKTLGREQPELWEPVPAGGRDSHVSGINLMAAEERIARKISQEYAKISVLSGQYTSIDPLMLAEYEWAAANAAEQAGELPASGEIDFESPSEKQIPVKVDVRRLRLMEIHRGERDIEELANEVVSDINLICMDDYRETKAIAEKPVFQPLYVDENITTDKEAAFHNLTCAVAIAADEDDASFVQPVTADTAIWG